ncbi:MAG: MBL fold metallo-hydrolase [Bacteroidetes bacterium]|nr:MBL fold metallo-hydrolase [Bacteroidota bacterium]
MSLSIASLNSGSNGNCYYVGNDQEAVLIDAGISHRETDKRLKRLGLSIKKVKAIFITHEHADHIGGLHKLYKKLQVPVYITRATLGNMRLSGREINPIAFQAYQPIAVGNLTITPLPKYHDAADPHSFVIEHNAVRVGVFTDTGRLCDDLIKSFAQCHAAFLEANYDEEMLETGNYPFHLKERIRKGFGHLSNKEALQLFLNHRPSFMSHLVLSHLSANNNTPEIVEELFRAVAGNTEIVIASRRNETAVYHITGSATDAISKLVNPNIKKSQTQLSLFDQLLAP